MKLSSISPHMPHEEEPQLYNPINVWHLTWPLGASYFGELLDQGLQNSTKGADDIFIPNERTKADLAQDHSVAQPGERVPWLCLIR